LARSAGLFLFTDLVYQIHRNISKCPSNEAFAMTIIPFWFIPSHGDGRWLGSDEGSRPTEFGYLSQVAVAADRLGFHGVLLPTGRTCEDSWVLASAETTPQGAPERQQAELPHRDIVVSDGDVLRSGDSVVKLYLTPGHTPGTISAIVQARTGAKTVPLSLFGSVAFPTTLGPTAHTAGLLTYDQSVQRFARISREAGAQGILNTHIFADGTRQRLDALRTHAPGDPNPFLIGAEATGRYYQVLHHCLLAAQARAADPGAANTGF